MSLPTRREHEAIEVEIGRHGAFLVRIGWDDQGMPCDVFLYGKKPNDDMQVILQELGIAASKLMQRRKPYYRPRRSWLRRTLTRWFAHAAFIVGAAVALALMRKE